MGWRVEPGYQVLTSQGSMVYPAIRCTKLNNYSYIEKRLAYGEQSDREKIIVVKRGCGREET